MSATPVRSGLAFCSVACATFAVLTWGGLHHWAPVWMWQPVGWSIAGGLVWGPAALAIAVRAFRYRQLRCQLLAVIDQLDPITRLRHAAGHTRLARDDHVLLVGRRLGPSWCPLLSFAVRIPEQITDDLDRERQTATSFEMFSCLPTGGVVYAKSAVWAALLPDGTLDTRRLKMGSFRTRRRLRRLDQAAGGRPRLTAGILAQLALQAQASEPFGTSEEDDRF